MENNIHNKYLLILDQLDTITSNILRKRISKYLTQLSALENNFTGYIKTIESINKNDINKTEEKSINYLIDLYKNNLTILNNLYSNIPIETETEDGFLLLEERLESFIKDQPGFIEIGQNRERFYLLKDDSVFWKILKTIKRFLYFISTLPSRIANLLRILFKQPKKQIKIWKHKIFLNKLIEAYLFPEYISEINSLIAFVNQQLTFYSFELFNKEKDALTKSIEKKVINSNWSEKAVFLDKSIQERLIKFRNDYANNFDKILEKCGTIELPKIWLKRKVTKVKRKTEEKYKRNYKLWHHTYYALFEDWRFRDELFKTISAINLNLLEFKNIFKDKISNAILPSYKRQYDYVQKLKDGLACIENDEISVLKSFIVKETYRLNKTLSEYVEETTEVLLVENLPNLFEKLETEVINSLIELPGRIGIVKNPDYSKGISASEIKYFSPKDFVEFEFLPVFSKKIRELKNQLAKEIESVLSESRDFHQIIDFCFDSALSLIDSDASTKEDVIKVLSEGFERALGINEGLSSYIKNTFQTQQTLVSESIITLCNQLERLDNNDNIFEIIVRLTRAKAIEKSKEKRIKVFSFINNKLKQTWLIITKTYGLLDILYRSLRKRLNLEKAPVIISSEVSNLLSDVQKRIRNLPLIYQRLFDNKPVEEENLFLSRDKEIYAVQKAYGDWQIGNYAATIILGENGGGKTSLLFNLFKKLKAKQKIEYCLLTDFYFSRGDYYKLIQFVFQDNDLTNDDKINNYFNSLASKKIIIIDGIERLFLRKINGFECIKMFLELIAKTNKNIFWICSGALHACNYLDKTIHLTDYFDYRIDLEYLLNEDIKNIILKRNRLSGYRIIYTEEEEDIKDRKVRKLKGQEKQKYLEQKFFEQLNKFSKSNISIAINFWLESIISIKSDEITIRGFSEPEFGFLVNLTPDKIYTLLIIIFHGRISVNLHAMIFNHQPEKSNRILLVMQEDSILIKKEKYFYLNTILYRHVIELLKNRNLIH